MGIPIRKESGCFYIQNDIESLILLTHHFFQVDIKREMPHNTLDRYTELPHNTQLLCINHQEIVNFPPTFYQFPAGKKLISCRENICSPVGNPQLPGGEHSLPHRETKKASYTDLYFDY